MNLSMFEEKEIRNQRLAMGMHQVWEPVHVSSTKDSSYYYSTYNGKDQDEVSNNKKIMILGGGPNRIGQGIEFDYCCVHAALALKKLGYSLNSTNKDEINEAKELLLALGMPLKN